MLRLLWPNDQANRADAAGKQSVEKPTSQNSENTSERPTTRRPLRLSVWFGRRIYATRNRTISLSPIAMASPM
jgi:hypothetical protein